MSPRAVAAFSLAAASLVAALAGAGSVLRQIASSREPDFGAEIRPILADRCFACHGVDPAKREARLRLDDRASAIARGAVVPGEPAASALVARIRATDDRIMPPRSSHRELDARERALLVRWVATGARYEPHWAFVAPVPVATPAAVHAIDAIVAPRLAKVGLALAPEAPRATLIRRLSLDLTGLPPTREDVVAFEVDPAADAYERLVDRLLASPHYGERMALPWLDAARYADSNGFQQDGDTFQWIWRDWLVRELNRDTPYDRLSTMMLAGDLMPDADDETRIGTAFLRNHLLNGEGGAIPEENRWTGMFDRVDATATTWLGLTMSCAQCHDHKFDPITQRDYYALLDGFNRVPESGFVDGSPSRIRVAPPVLECARDDQRARRTALEAEVAAGAEGAQGRLEQFMRDEWPRVMVMSDAQPRETRVLVRGVYTSPGEPVAFGTPAFLPPMRDEWPRNRLGLAKWLFAAENPLVARVAANRAWQVFFGEGLVRTPEDFGVQGDRPEYPELLDTLAVLLREGGWSMKSLHRQIVTSRVYRQSSRCDDALRARDPDNRLLARAARIRIPSPILRDAALAVAGLLERQVGGAPVYPYQPPRVWESLAITKERDFDYPASHGADLYRRSLYTFWRRTVAPANMFDASQRQSCRVRVPVTHSPLHALTMLNDPTYVEAARVLAQSVSGGGTDTVTRCAQAFERVLGRPPAVRERAALAAMCARQHAYFKADPEAAGQLLAVGESARAADLEPVEHATLTAACLAILNLDEAITRE